MLRDYFRTDRSFSDYYADFAEELEAAHFERNVPAGLEVLEFRFEGPGEARVQVRIAGRNGQPLRVGKVRGRARGSLGARRRHLVDRSRQALSEPPASRREPRAAGGTGPLR